MKKDLNKICIGSANFGTKYGINQSKVSEKELKKIPFFVRGKVKRNTENYARQAGCREINEETLYDAKAFYS